MTDDEKTVVGQMADDADGAGEEAGTEPKAAEGETEE